MDFRVLLTRDSVPPGVTRLAFRNDGPTEHEAILVRTDLPVDHLPLQEDALTVDEDALDTVTAVEGIPLWTSRSATVDLRPGRYVLYCNLDGHYLGGMRTTLDVEAQP